MMALSPEQMKVIIDSTTRTWLEPLKVRLRLLAGVKFKAAKNNDLLAAMAVADQTTDERLIKARDSFIIMARMIHGDSYAEFAKEFEKEKRVLFVERETIGEIWNRIVPSGRKLRTWHNR